MLTCVECIFVESLSFRHAFNSVVDEEVSCDVSSFVVNAANCVGVFLSVDVRLSISSLSCVGLSTS